MAKDCALGSRDRIGRIVGNDKDGAIYFLPWRLSFGAASALGLLGLKRWRLCYELPTAIVHSDPARCAQAIRRVVDDASEQIERQGRPPPLLVGFSMGSVPATMLAGQYRARLWSFASADRGDLMIWQSPAARAVRREAEANGVTLGDFTTALRGLNPIDWCNRIDPTSHFAIGSFDRYVPRLRRRALVRTLGGIVPTENIVFEPFGHLGVMALSPWRQRQWQQISRAAPPA